MANDEKDDELTQANAGAPAADIPDLKKKEKERKKAGAAWSGVRGSGGGNFTGATGGSGAVARAAASAAGAAPGVVVSGAARAGLGAWLSRVIAGLAATAMGKVALAGAAMGFLVGLGALGAALFGGAGSQASVGSPSLSPISSDMKVRGGSGDRMAVNSRGEIRFDPVKPGAKPEPPKEPEPAPEPTQAAEAVPQPNLPTGWMPQDRLAHNLSGAKLSTNLGGQFGGKNIFGGAGNPNAPKFGDAAAASGIGPRGSAGQKGRLGNMAGRSVRAKSNARGVSRGKTGKAIGQLRLARGLSVLGAQAGNPEAAAGNALGAFEQGRTTGGELNPIGGADGKGTVNPPGGLNTGMPEAPETPATSTPYKPIDNQMKQIGNTANQAMQMKMMGMMLLAIGAILIAIGSQMPPPANIALIIAGIALIAMGMMMMMMAQNMANQAKQMGNDVAKEVGPYQGEVVNHCTDKALQGIPVESCNPPDAMTREKRFLENEKNDIERVKEIPKDNIQMVPVDKGATSR